MNGTAASFTSAIAAEVLAICIKRKDALLHPGAAGGADQHQRDSLVGGASSQAGDLLADHRAHRPAHEREVHHPEMEWDALELARPGIRSHRDPPVFLQAASGPVAIVLEAERIAERSVAVELPPASRVGQQLDVLLRGEAPVMIRIRADVERSSRIFSRISTWPQVSHLLPGVSRDLEPVPAGKCVAYALS